MKEKTRTAETKGRERGRKRTSKREREGREKDDKGRKAEEI